MKRTDHAVGEARREDIPMQTRLLQIGSVDEKTRTVTLDWSTGADVQKIDRYDGTRYIERLSLDPNAVHLDRLNVGAPLLNSHGLYDLSNQIGVVEKAWLETGVGKATVRFPKAGVDENADRIFSMVQDGIIRNVSVGYIVNRYEVEDNQGNGLDIWTAVDWEPLELSLVTVPADAGAGVRSADKAGESRYACEFVVRASPASLKENKKMVLKTDNIPVADDPVAGSEQRIAPDAKNQEIADAAVKKERARIADIHNRCAVAGMTREFSEDLVARGVSSEAAGNLIIDEMAKRSAAAKPAIPAAGSSAHTPAGGLDADETRRSAVSEAMLNRAFPNLKDFSITDRAKEWRGYSLREMARELLTESGVRTRGLSPMEICKRALSTGDFPYITANVMNRSLQAGYGMEQRTYAPFCNIRNAADFKTIYSLQFGEGSNLDEVKEAEEYKYAAVGENQETWSLRKFGKILPITYEVLMNDDLNAFSRVPFNFGQAAVRKENDIVWGLLIDNGKLSDGKALFSTNHSNLYTGTTTALSLAALQTVRKGFRKQKGLDGNANLNLQIRYVMVGSANETTLEQILSPALFAAQVGNIVPEYYRSLIPIVESRIDNISDTAWFAAADPSSIATIEYGYLDGQQGVYLETKDGFERDGIEVKVRHVFGAGAVNWRGLALATGVAPA